MKTFDFEHPSFVKNSLNVQLMMRRIYQASLTEEEFATALKEAKPHGTPPSYIRNMYRRLVNNYSFFK